MLSLTARRREILELLLVGDEDKEIAEKLGIAPSSVASALLSLRDETDSRNRVELAVWYSHFKEHNKDLFPAEGEVSS